MDGQQQTTQHRWRLAPVLPRNPGEKGRSASTLELFFDLVFVVAVSVASVQLHHSLTEGHFADGLLSYAVVFFGIWWAWMNFTWYATSFDNDDWLYRVLTILQMAGVLVLAAGIEPAFSDRDFRVLVYGYVVMRVAMIGQWLRAAAGSKECRDTALMYAGGIGIVQVLWLAQLALPEAARNVALVVLIIAELAVPVVSEAIGHGTPWHPHHITERYGLFTLIVLGESLLGSANAIIEAVHEHDDLTPLILLAGLTLVVTAALWWIYFWPPHHESIGGLQRSIRYGYVHYFVFGAAGALSAGIEVEIDAVRDKTEVSSVAASFTFTVPVAVFILGIWWIAMRDYADRIVNIAVPAAAVLVLINPLLPGPVALTAIVLIAVVVVLVWRPPVDRDSSMSTSALVRS